MANHTTNAASSLVFSSPGSAEIPLVLVEHAAALCVPGWRSFIELKGKDPGHTLFHEALALAERQGVPFRYFAIGDCG